MTHCSTKAAQDTEMAFLMRLFTRNGYPHNFILRCIQDVERPTPNVPNSLATLPYVNNVSEAAARLLRRFNVTFSHQPMSTLRENLGKPRPRRVN